MLFVTDCWFIPGKKLLFAFSSPELLSAFVQRRDTTPSSLPETHCIRRGILLYDVLWVWPQPSLTGQTVSGRREDNTVNSLKIWWRGLIDQKKNLSGSWDCLGGARNSSLIKITACPGQSRSDVWCHLAGFLGLSCSPKSTQPWWWRDVCGSRACSALCRMRDFVNLCEIKSELRDRSDGW